MERLKIKFCKSILTLIVISMSFSLIVYLGDAILQYQHTKYVIVESTEIEKQRAQETPVCGRRSYICDLRDRGQVTGDKCNCTGRQKYMTLDIEDASKTNGNGYNSSICRIIVFFFLVFSSILCFIYIYACINYLKSSVESAKDVELVEMAERWRRIFCASNDDRSNPTQTKENRNVSDDSKVEKDKIDDSKIEEAKNEFNKEINQLYKSLQLAVYAKIKKKIYEKNEILKITESDGK